MLAAPQVTGTEGFFGLSRFRSFLYYYYY